MSISDADIAFVKDHFAGVGTLTTRKMFGGLAIYADGVICALIISTGALMIKAKGALASDLAAQGSQQFIHDGKGTNASPYPIGPCPTLQWTSRSWPAIGPDALCCKTPK